MAATVPSTLKHECCRSDTRSQASATVIVKYAAHKPIPVGLHSLGFANSKVMSSLSPMAVYLARSCWPRASVGGKYQTG